MKFTISEKSIQEMLIHKAYQCVGIRESGGNNQGAAIKKFQTAVDGVASGEPWCLGFVQWVVKEVCTFIGIKNPLFQTEHCMTLWRNTALVKKHSVCNPGDLAVFKSRGSDSGHIGIVVQTTPMAPGTFLAVEGNTNENGGREGNQVAVKTRQFGANGSLDLVGFINLPGIVSEAVTRANLR